MRRAQHPLAFTDWVAGVPRRRGAAKFGGVTIPAEAPTSRRHRRQDRGNPREESHHEAAPREQVRAPKGRRSCSDARGAAGPERFGAAPRRSEAAAPRPAAVDTKKSSDIVKKSKKLYESRGLAVSYQSSRASPRVAPVRVLEPAETGRCAPRLGSPVEASSCLPAPLSAAVSEWGGPRRMPAFVEAFGSTFSRGMGLASFAGTGALLAEGGRRGGRWCNERVRFGVGASWIRSGRDATHLAGSVRARRGRSGA